MGPNISNSYSSKNISAQLTCRALFVDNKSLVLAAGGVSHLRLVDVCLSHLLDTNARRRAMLRRGHHNLCNVSSFLQAVFSSLISSHLTSFHLNSLHCKVTQLAAAK